jgi:hypothetical protein
VNIANLFASAQSLLVVLAGLVTLAEDKTSSGADKKAAVLSALAPVINALPVAGVAGTVLKAAANALAPTAIDLIVAKANAAGLLPSSAQPAALQP